MNCEDCGNEIRKNRPPGKKRCVECEAEFELEEIRHGRGPMRRAAHTAFGSLAEDSAFDSSSEHFRDRQLLEPRL